MRDWLSAARGRLDTAVRADWLTALYRHDLCQRQIAAAAVGTTMVNLIQGCWGAADLPLPPATEQDRICAVLDAHRRRIDSQRRELKKLRLVKRGLMRDLLTGRVPVQLTRRPPS